MLDHRTLEALRRHPLEWRRRGLTPPDELAAIVDARLTGTTMHHVPSNPSYADFFTS